MLSELGTRLYTFIFGKYVGTDEFGNRYYKGSAKEGKHIGNSNKERRWVIYRNRKEPSTVPGGWHGWLHYIIDDIPTDLKSHKWQKHHIQSLTGTNLAYVPSDHAADHAESRKQEKSYSSWKP